jgi:hypothetical protein
MKSLLIFILIPLQNLAQERAVNQIDYQARRDSILLETEFGSIYFTRDTSAVSYDYLNPAQIDSSVFNQFYREMQLELEDSFSIQTKHFDYPLINSHWTNIFRFDNSYCLFGPSDWMAHTEVLFTDSLHYNLGSDGDFEFIHSVSIINSNTCEFDLITFMNEHYFLSVRIVDQIKGIALFEWFDSAHDSLGKTFFVQSEKVRNFPMIIYDCGNQKCAFGDVYFFQPHDFSAY